MPKQPASAPTKKPATPIGDLREQIERILQAATSGTDPRRLKEAVAGQIQSGHHTLIGQIAFGSGVCKFTLEDEGEISIEAPVRADGGPERQMAAQAPSVEPEFPGFTTPGARSFQQGDE